MKPEEVGALWDEKIGAPEVAAVLARLAAEKKIATAAAGKTLTMRLLVPLGDFDGYDRELVQALFFGGRKETDTDEIKTALQVAGLRSGVEDPARPREGAREARGIPRQVSGAVSAGPRCSCSPARALSTATRC